MIPQFVVTCPSDLARLAGEISSEQVQLPITTVELQLLLPLTTSDEVERCLNDVESFSCHAYDLRTTKRDAIRVLSLTPMFKTWRLVWSKFPPEAVQNFIFNINLPASSIVTTWADSRIYWRRSVPNTGGLAVLEGRVFQAVLELATVMRIRSKGKASFSLKGVEEYVAMQSQNDRRKEIVFSNLEATLQQLSN
ncbi:hypothetical protein D6C95_08943 [Aureobasidium pullulans]|nr:hypothetical protein D6C95_08943 [Aureobasidium pullulans]